MQVQFWGNWNYTIYGKSVVLFHTEWLFYLKYIEINIVGDVFDLKSGLKLW